MIVEQFFFDSLQFLFRFPEQFEDNLDCEPQFNSAFSKDFINTIYTKKYPIAGATNIQDKIYSDIISHLRRTNQQEYENFCKAFKTQADFNAYFVRYLNSSHGEDIFNRICQKKFTLQISKACISKLKCGNIVVFCLTEKISNKKMWDEYANNHRGFAIAVNTEAELFYNFRQPDSLFGCLKKVKYQPKENSALFSDYFTPSGFQFKQCLQETIFTKALDFSFENEWRVILFPAGLPPSDDITRHEDGLLISVPHSIIKGVYLGASATDNVRAAAMQFCSTHATPLFQMVRTPDQTFTAEPVALDI